MPQKTSSCSGWRMESRLIYGTQEIRLSTNIFTIGRGRICNLQIQSQFISEIQCYLLRRYKEGMEYFQLIDGNLDGKPSRNGTYLNGRRLTLTPIGLKNEDKISFANTQITYRIPIKCVTTDDAFSKSTLEAPA